MSKFHTNTEENNEFTEDERSPVFATDQDFKNIGAGEDYDDTDQAGHSFAEESDDAAGVSDDDDQPSRSIARNTSDEHLRTVGSLEVLELSDSDIDGMLDSLEEESGLKVFDDVDSSMFLPDGSTNHENSLVDHYEFDENDELAIDDRGKLARIFKPDGENLNKTVVGLCVSLLMLIGIGYVMFAGDSGGAKNVAVATDPDAAPEVTRVNSEDLNPMLGDKQMQIAASQDANINLSNSNTGSLLGADANAANSTMQPGVVPPGGMPTTTTQTTVQEVPITTAPQNQGITAGSTISEQPQPRAQQEPRRPEVEGASIIMRQGKRIEERGDLESVQQYNQQKNRDQGEKSASTLNLGYGTRIVLELKDPIRSGIQTTVQARSIGNIRDNGGNVIIPAGAIFDITINPQEVNGRVFAQETVRWANTNGEVYVIKASVKGGDGYEGITGKIKKVGGGGNRLGKVLKGVGRAVIEQIPGVAGGVINDAANDAQGGYDVGDQISYSRTVVEVPAGTRILLTIK